MEAASGPDFDARLACDLLLALATRGGGFSMALSMIGGAGGSAARAADIAAIAQAARAAGHGDKAEAVAKAFG